LGDLLVLLDGTRTHAYGADDLAVPHQRDAAGEHGHVPAVGVAQPEDGALRPRRLLQVRRLRLERDGGVGLVDRETVMLPTNAPSILTCDLRLPPASTTAMSSGCPISPALRLAASMTLRASPSVTVSLVFAISAMFSPFPVGFPV
jgi:hypothetical protein